MFLKELEVIFLLTAKHKLRKRLKANHNFLIPEDLKRAAGKYMYKLHFMLCTGRRLCKPQNSTPRN